jgi:MFS family permease
MLGILSRDKSKRVLSPQFWLLFWGLFVNRASLSMMWPFLTVFLTRDLGLSLTTATLLISLRSFSSILSTAVVTPLMDKFGRVKAMALALIGSALIFTIMAFTRDPILWGVLMFAHGLVLPVFNIGVYAIVADIVEDEHRPHAYSLIRMIANAGIAIGPIVGGAMALVSFNAIFICMTILFSLLGVLVFVMLKEVRTPEQTQKEKLGFRYLFSDKVFMLFIGGFILIDMAYAHIWTLLPQYTSSQFGLLETQYSLFVTINAVMVVLFQVGVSRVTNRFNAWVMISLGGFLYGIGMISIAFGSTFWHFALSMIIVTIGELIASPIALTVAARLAPENMRARYMGVLELVYPIASGIGPVMGGVLSDNIAPVAMWYSAGLMAFIGASIFVMMWRFVRLREAGELHD